MQAATKAETDRLSQFLVEVKHDLRCAHTRCSDRFFRPSVEATMDSPFFGLNKEVTELEANVESIEGYLDMLR